ncbi:MAG: insulinase family protein [Candidatus Melainabacteria bacterium]|nr:MAG: insulinase family protein [Candidatus Melainabacteria bacterium]
MKRIILALFVLFLNINIAFCADFTTFKLENGHTFIIKPIHTNPIVTIDTWVKTGSINEDDKNNGIAHFLEHMFLKAQKIIKPVNLIEF